MWTETAIETLRQMALEGKSASSIAAALGAPSRNAVIGKANRIGVKLTGNIHCSAPRAAAIGHGAAASPRDRAHGVVGEARRCPRRPARAEAGMGFRRSAGRRDAEGRARGDPRRRLPLADWRPDKRGIRLLRHSDGEGPLLLRRTLPDGLQAAEFPGVGRRSVTWLSSPWPPRKAATRHLHFKETDGGARPREAMLSRGRDLLPVRPPFPAEDGRVLRDVDGRFLGSSIMSNASFSRPLGTAMVGGAIAMAILDLLVRKNVLTVDDVQGGLTDGPKLARQLPRCSRLSRRREDHRRDQGPVRAPGARPME